MRGRPRPERRHAWVRAGLAGVLALLIAAAAPADDDDDDDDEEDTPAAVLPAPGGAAVAPGGTGAAPAPKDAERALRLDAGLGPYAYPLYPGSRRYGVLPYPLVTLDYAGRVEVDSLDGARFTLLELGNVSLGPAIRYRFGRQLGDDPARLAGLRSFGPSVEPGGFLRWEKGPLTLDAVLTQDMTQHQKGAVLTLAGYYAGEHRGIGFEAGPYLQATTGAYTKSFYGVPEGPGTALPAYRTHAGWERVGAEAVVSIPIGGRWSVQLVGEYGYLLGSAAHSPIVAQGGTRNLVFGGAFLSYGWP